MSDPNDPTLIQPAGPPSATPAPEAPPPPVGMPLAQPGHAVLAPTPVKAKTSTGSKILIGLGVVFVGLLALGMLSVVLVSLAFRGGDNNSSALRTAFVTGDKTSENRVVAIPVNGVILGEDAGSGGGLFGSLTGVSYGYTVAEQLAEAAEDDTIDAIVLEMDTPGGTIFGSRVINKAVLDYQAETGRPVLAHVRGISASGGMYAMAGADQILADHGTLIGSIGVRIGPFLTYEDVVAIDQGIFVGGVSTEGGITAEVISAGRNKDLGNPWRPMNEEERATLQRGVDRAYGEFVSVVAEGRGIDPSVIRDDLGALIFDEATAVDNGLIDGVADRDEAYAAAAELAGIAVDDWQAERLAPKTAGLLSLLASNPNANDSAVAISPGFCSGAASMLAYHGDPRTLCASFMTASENN